MIIWTKNTSLILDFSWIFSNGWLLHITRGILGINDQFSWFSMVERRRVFRS